MNNLRIQALLAGLLIGAVGCGNADATDTETVRPAPTSSFDLADGLDLTDGECHISAEEVASWPETSARLPRACDEPTTGTYVIDGECHISAEEVANWPETSARLPKACDE